MQFSLNYLNLCQDMNLRVSLKPITQAMHLVKRHVGEEGHALSENKFHLFLFSSSTYFYFYSLGEFYPEVRVPFYSSGITRKALNNFFESIILFLASK